MEKGTNCSPGAISPLFHNICDLILNFCVETWTRFSLRDKRLFEITEVEITRVDCMFIKQNFNTFENLKNIKWTCFTSLHKMVEVTLET